MVGKVGVEPTIPLGGSFTDSCVCRFATYPYNGCDGGDCTHDLQVMSLTSYYCSTPRYKSMKVSSLIHLQLIGTG